MKLVVRDKVSVSRHGVFRNLKMRGRNGVLSGHPLRYCMKGDKGYCVMEDLRVEDCDIDAWGHAISFTAEAVKAIDVAGVQGLDMKSFSVTSGVGAK